jgi:hypothetical protein
MSTDLTKFIKDQKKPSILVGFYSDESDPYILNSIGISDFSGDNNTPSLDKTILNSVETAVNDTNFSIDLKKLKNNSIDSTVEGGKPQKRKTKKAIKKAKKTTHKRKSSKKRKTSKK